MQNVKAVVDLFTIQPVHGTVHQVVQLMVFTCGV